MNYDEVLEQLKALGHPHAAEKAASFGIRPTVPIYGVPVPELRRIARQIGTDHTLAGQLWQSNIHDARLLATMIDDPARVTEAQMERWVRDFDAWDVCDQCCGNLFDRTPFANQKTFEWSARPEEFVKRAGFVLMAYLAVHDKGASNEQFIAYLSVIRREAGDDRNFVKKAVCWALRQIGKRNLVLNRHAIDAAYLIHQMDSQAARWTANIALRELTGLPVQKRLYKLRD